MRAKQGRGRINHFDEERPGFSWRLYPHGAFGSSPT